MFKSHSELVLEHGDTETRSFDFNRREILCVFVSLCSNQIGL